MSVVNLNKAVQNYPFIENISHLNLQKCGVKNVISLQLKKKLFKNINHWNPLLVMIAFNHQKAVEQLLLSKVSEFLHLGTSLSK